MNSPYHIPYHIQIRDYLLTLISDLEANARIPSEAELVEKFGVSRGTAKQAITSLVNEGCLYRVQGKGTFVSPKKIDRNFEQLPTFSGDIRNQGYNPVYKVISFSLANADKNIREKLHMKNDQVIRFKRVMYLNEDPIAVVCSYLNTDIFPDFRQQDLGSSLYASLKKKYSLVPVKALDTYSIVTASPKTAALLNYESGAPLFFSERIGFLSDDKPAEYVESFIRGDKYQLSVRIGFDDAPGNTVVAEQIAHNITP